MLNLVFYLLSWLVLSGSPWTFREIWAVSLFLLLPSLISTQFHGFYITSLVLCPLRFNDICCARQLVIATYMKRRGSDASSTVKNVSVTFDPSSPLLCACWSTLISLYHKSDLLMLMWFIAAASFTTNKPLPSLDSLLHILQIVSQKTTWDVMHTTLVRGLWFLLLQHKLQIFKRFKYGNEEFLKL